MSKRLNLREVQKIVKEICGYTIIDNEYKNKDTKMSYIDNNGYKYYCTFGNLKKTGKSRAFHSNNPYTIDNIKLWMKLNDRTDTLISTEYKSNGSKNKEDTLSFVCKRGHEFKKTWSDYQQGSACNKCAREDYVRKSVKESYGYDIIDIEIKDEHTKMSYVDDCGYKYYYTLSSLRSKGSASAFHISNPYTIDNIRLWIKLNNRTDMLISTEYSGSGVKNREDKLSFVCKNGHEFEMCWTHYRQGRGCAKCVRRYENGHDFAKVVKEVHGDEFSILGDYVNSATKILMKHNKCGHKWMATPNSITQGHGCPNPKCSHKRGEEHYKWNPSLTDEDRKRNSSRLTQLGYKKWRGDVLGKCNNKCIVCGAKKTKDNKLIPHHLNSWDTHIDERFDVDNGVAICEKHHNEFHMAYGYGNNTKEQFEEYLNNKEKEKSGV